MTVAVSVEDDILVRLRRVRQATVEQSYSHVDVSDTSNEIAASRKRLDMPT